MSSEKQLNINQGISTESIEALYLETRRPEPQQSTLSEPDEPW